MGTTTLDFHKMSDFLGGHLSKIITKPSEKDKATIVRKNNARVAEISSVSRQKRLIKAGINITNY